MLSSNSSTQIWLLGSSINTFLPDLTFSVGPDPNDIKPNRLYSASSWQSFQGTVTVQSRFRRSRIVLISAVSVLSHGDIAQMRQMQEQYSWFIPVLYFDTPDLDKVIHAFDSDFTGYATYGDCLSELNLLVQRAAVGKLYYSTGFCNLLNSYGFSIDETNC